MWGKKFVWSVKSVEAEETDSGDEMNGDDVVLL